MNHVRAISEEEWGKLVKYRLGSRQVRRVGLGECINCEAQGSKNDVNEAAEMRLPNRGEVIPHNSMNLHLIAVRKVTSQANRQFLLELPINVLVIEAVYQDQASALWPAQVAVKVIAKSVDAEAPSLLG
ncbi:MAG: hypothetical protein ACK50Z_16405 [Betaproteobacteria bacterium]